jgi:sulfur carrier protein ThiS
MKVKVRLFGTLRRLSQPGTPGIWEGEIVKGSSIYELLEMLGAGKYEANVAAINGVACSLDTRIVEESEITVVTPMGGG